MLVESRCLVNQIIRLVLIIIRYLSAFGEALPVSLWLLFSMHLDA
jgi:hypothetical protein